MADTVANQQSSGNDFSNVFSGLVDLGKTGLTAYFADDAAKAALKAPPANTLIVVGGLVVVAIVIFMVMKK